MGALLMSVVMMIATYVVKFREDFDKEQVQKSALLLSVIFLGIVILKLLSK